MLHPQDEEPLDLSEGMPIHEMQETHHRVVDGRLKNLERGQQRIERRVEALIGYARRILRRLDK